MRRSKRWGEVLADDKGTSSLEFVTAGLILLLPLVYLVLTMSAIQAGALAAEGAARQAARVYVLAPDEQTAKDAAGRAVEFALADHGVTTESARAAITCRPEPGACLTRRAFVTVDVAISVPLPLLPPVLVGDFPLAVQLDATATQQVSRFWGSE